MKSRKTFKVENFKNIINEKLALGSINQDEKKALTVVLERVLHDTNNYRGYNNLQWMRGGSEKWNDHLKKHGKANILDFHGPEYDRQYY